MHGVTEGDEALTAHDSAARHDMEVHLQIPDGSGGCRTLVTTGRRRTSFRHCRNHFVALGVCVDCTQTFGTAMWAL